MVFKKVFKLTWNNKYVTYSYRRLGIYQVNLNPGVKKSVPKVCSLSSDFRLALHHSTSNYMPVSPRLLHPPLFMLCVWPRMF